MCSYFHHVLLLPQCQHRKAYGGHLPSAVKVQRICTTQGADAAEPECHHCIAVVSQALLKGVEFPKSHEGLNTYNNNEQSPSESAEHRAGVSPEWA